MIAVWLWKIVNHFNEVSSFLVHMIDDDIVKCEFWTFCAEMQHHLKNRYNPLKNYCSYIIRLWYCKIMHWKCIDEETEQQWLILYSKLYTITTL